MSDDNVMCYVARKPGSPGFCAVLIDDGKFPKEDAKTIAGWIRQGRTLERVPLEVAQSGMDEFLAARKAAK